MNTRAAILAGVGAGLLVVIGYLAAGFAFERWSLIAFLETLTLLSLGRFFLAVGLAIAVVGIPITAYLRFQAVLPLLLFALVVFVWIVIGSSRGLPPTAFFELAIYAAWFAPIYLVLYIAAVGVEVALQHSATI